MYFWKKDTFLLVYLTVMTLAAQEGNIFATNFTTSTTGISSTTVEDSTSESTQTTSVSESTPSPTTEGTSTSEVTSSTTGISSTTVEDSTSESTQTVSSSSLTTEGTSTSEVTSSTTGISSTTVEDSTSKQTPTTSSSESSPSPTTEGTSTSEVTLTTTGTSSTTVENSSSDQTQTTGSSKSSPSSTTEGIRTSKVTLFTEISTLISTVQTCVCDCNGSPCFLNQTIGKCQCLCKPSTFGDKCNFVNGSSPADLSGNTPTRKAKISLRLMMDFLPAYGNVNSAEYKHLTSILKREISILCRRADDRNFKDVNITNLRPGSVIADSIAEHNYPNNNTQIQFLNNGLVKELERIFNDSESFKNLSSALGSVSIENITMETPEIFNITDLQEYVRCTLGFANFTAELVDDEWVCVAPCEKDPNYCSKRGQCFNGINGSQCQCDRSNFEEYYGTNCELYRRGAAFYAALFGSLAAFIVIVIVVIVVVVVLRFRASSRVHSKEGSISHYENMPYQENAPVRAI